MSFGVMTGNPNVQENLLRLVESLEFKSLCEKCQQLKTWTKIFTILYNVTYSMTYNMTRMTHVTLLTIHSEGHLYYSNHKTIITIHVKHIYFAQFFFAFVQVETTFTQPTESHRPGQPIALLLLLHVATISLLL